MYSEIESILLRDDILVRILIFIGIIASLQFLILLSNINNINIDIKNLKEKINIKEKIKCHAPHLLKLFDKQKRLEAAAKETEALANRSEEKEEILEEALEEALAKVKEAEEALEEAEEKAYAASDETEETHNMEDMDELERALGAAVEAEAEAAAKAEAARAKAASIAEELRQLNIETKKLIAAASAAKKAWNSFNRLSVKLGGKKKMETEQVWFSIITLAIFVIIFIKL